MYHDRKDFKQLNMYLYSYKLIGPSKLEFLIPGILNEQGINS